MVPDDAWDVASFVLRSQYRVRTLETLADDGPCTPSDIATARDMAQPHVSRALSELREKGAIELLVPEEQSRGRYYDLSEEGERAWSVVRDQIRSVRWRRDSPETDEQRRVVDAATERLGEDLRTVGHYDGEAVTSFYMRRDLEEEYSDDDVREGLERLAFEDAARQYERADSVGGTLRFEVKGFEEFTLVRLLRGGDGHYSVSFETDAEVSPCALVEEFQRALDGETP